MPDGKPLPHGRPSCPRLHLVDLALTARGSRRVHEHLLSIVRPLPSDFEPWGERSDDERGADCSCGCRWFYLLTGSPGADWGVCANPASPRCAMLTFEHMGCDRWEDSKEAPRGR